MARPRLDRAELRRRLLRAAIDQIRDRGASAFSLREAARAAGVDPAMVYREFADRADLVEQVALDGFARLAERVRDATDAAAAVDPDPLTARLWAFGTTYVRFALEHPTEFQVMFAGGRRTALPTDVPSAYDQLVALLDPLATAGRLRGDRDRAALVCWSAVHGAAWHLVDRALAGDPTEPDAVVQVVVGHLVASLIEAPR
ncbi:MAG: TetR/AcrR family transcriptional regulator [Myxococcota bacterium]